MNVVSTKPIDGSISCRSITPDHIFGLIFLFDYALMQTIMTHESYDSAEELALGQRLVTAARDRAMQLRQRERRGSFQSYGLQAPDGTRISLAVFPVNLDIQDFYVPPLQGNALAKDVYDLPAYDGAKYYRSMHQAHDISGMQPEDGPRLAFVAETHPSPDSQAKPTYAVSSAGEVERPVEAAHYEGFVDPDGNFVGLYKLGEEQTLEPVDDVEGERLLWQMTNGELV